MKMTIDRSALYLRVNGKVNSTKSLLLPLSDVEFSVLSNENGTYTLTADRTATRVLAHFDNEYDAIKALHRISSKLQRHFMAMKAVRIFKGVFWPLTAIALIVSLNGAVMNLREPSSVVALPGAPQATSSAPQAAPSTPVASAPQTPPPAPRPQLMNALNHAAKSGKFTVSMSQGKKHTLYVFSDPLCTHCRSFEPVLERLTANYNIEVFPVSLVGDEAQIAQSGAINRHVLSVDAGERIKRWQQVMRGEISDARRSDSNQELNDRVNANNQAFQLLGFTGTPSVVSDDGREIEPDVIKDPARLSAFFAEKD